MKRCQMDVFESEQSAFFQATAWQMRGRPPSFDPLDKRDAAFISSYLSYSYNVILKVETASFKHLLLMTDDCVVKICPTMASVCPTRASVSYNGQCMSYNGRYVCPPRPP